jgi:hypothetical protein
MARRARWIRFGCVDEREWQGACDGFSAAQTSDAAPIVLWGCARGAKRYRYALMAPAHVAPGRQARWVSWALSPAVAAYRDFGLRAYLDGSDICLHGQCIGGGRAESIGHCIVVASHLDGSAPLTGSSACAPEFRAWLREGLGIAMTQWGAEGGAPAERAFESALRARIEAQHGWEFETAWPLQAEQAAIDGARRELLGSITATG